MYHFVTQTVCYFIFQTECEYSIAVSPEILFLSVYSLGVHLKFDRRLEILKSNDRYSEDGAEIRLDTKESNTLFLASFPVWDGETWRFHVKLPSDIQVGDIYPISIMYRKNENAADMCIDKDKSNNAMEAWAFTQGVEHGYIKIINNDPNYVPQTTTTTTSTSTTTTTSKTTTTTTTTTTTSSTLSLGDVNNDNLINAVDASTVLSYYAMISTNKDGGFSEAQKTAGDVNKDGSINAVDASCILSYYAYVSTSKEEIMSLGDFIKNN